MQSTSSSSSSSSSSSYYYYYYYYHEELSATRVYQTHRARAVPFQRPRRRRQTGRIRIRTPRASIARVRIAQVVVLDIVDVVVDASTPRAGCGAIADARGGARDVVVMLGGIPRGGGRRRPIPPRVGSTRGVGGMAASRRRRTGGGGGGGDGRAAQE